jgi:predicted phosphodiesterase
MTTDLTPYLEGAERLLFFGGPYSNLEATKAMRAKAARLGIDKTHTICTGDVVAYCANPAETVAEIRDWGIHVVSGNCEQQLAAGASDCGCGFSDGSACDILSKGWFGFADARINRDDRDWMGDLPDEVLFTWAGRRFRVVHGACNETSRFVFPSQHDVMAEQLGRCGADIVVAGHSGLPFGHLIGQQAWLNAGVIGKPANDGTRDGWYGLMSKSPEGISFELRRLAYDAETARAAVLAAGCAIPYGETLGTGLWPNNDVLPATETSAQGLVIAEESFVLPGAAPDRENAA